MVANSIRFYLLKKKFYILMRGQNPDWNKNSLFMKYLEKYGRDKKLGSVGDYSTSIKSLHIQRNNSPSLIQKKAKKRDQWSFGIQVESLGNQEQAIYKEMNNWFL